MPKSKYFDAARGTFYYVFTPRSDGAARDIVFQPIRGKVVPPEYAALHFDIERTLATLNSLFSDTGASWLKSRNARNSRKFDEYFGKLSGVAMVGLGQDQPQLGRMALLGLQDEVITREGGAVKNGYLRRLGFSALVLAAIAVALYVIPYETVIALPESLRLFTPLVLGALLGTWLSFSLRRPVLTFADLAHLEEDRLDPSIRLLFVVGLTIVVGLLLSTEAIDVGIGKLKTSTSLTNPTVAFLVGCLCGIGEKGLSTAVSRRAADFVASLAGAVAPASKKNGELPKEPPAKSTQSADPKQRRGRRKRR